MTRGLVAVFVLAPWTVMAQRFDVVAFDVPPGWTSQALGDGLMFESRPPGTHSFCQVFLRRSRTATAPLPQELDRVWAEMTARQPLVAEGPDPAPLDLPSGFRVAQRVGGVQTGTGTLIVMLNLLQQGDRLVPVVVNLADSKAMDLCGPAAGDFLASLRIDTSPPPPPPVPVSDPTLAAKFGNSVVGTWRHPLTSVTVALNAPTQLRNVVEIRFGRDAAYRIVVNLSSPGGGSIFSDTETGRYEVDGQRIVMRPAPGSGKETYALDWFFGDRPDSPGNWGLILRSNTQWLGSFNSLPTNWRTFRPPE
jgi:hypothetical protein